VLVVAVAVLAFGVLMFVPKSENQNQAQNQNTPSMAYTPASDPIQFSVFDAGAFGDLGIYLCRPDTVRTNNVYKATISTENLIDTNNKTSFHPTFYALKRNNDRWVDITNDENADFWVDTTEDDTSYSVAWYLRETAPAAVYCVRCSYEEDYGDYTENVNEDFLVLYTQYWTYINVTNDDGARRITNWVGGSDLTLYLNVTFNAGAADPSLEDTDQTTGSTDVRVGAIEKSNNIVSAQNMSITVKTASGKVYSTQDVLSEVDVNNRIALRFNESLGDDIYIVQFTSNANNRIIGQFIIDNTEMQGGVNLSQFWVVLMIFGGFLALGAASAYLIPLMIVKVNEARVYKEKERVDRLKNPDKYAKKDKKSLKEVVDNIVYKIKTPKYKRNQEKKEEQEVQDEPKEYTNRFTEMLRERQEKRDFMQEHNVTSAEMEKMKEAEANAAADEANSFAFLREDDDDEIATFHAAEDEISTLETGSYVQDGATFAKLDSMRDDEQTQDDNGNSGNDGK